MIKYVYCTFVGKNYNDEPINRVNITNKKEWDADEGCNDDGIGDKDKKINKILDELELVEESECNFVTNISLDIVKAKLELHPSFEYDQKFHDFMIASYTW